MILVDEANVRKKEWPGIHELLSHRWVGVPSLVNELSRVPDPRKARGKRHPLGAMLALTCVALLCGCRSPVAISEWAHNYRLAYLRPLGFTRRDPPGQATWYRVLGSIDWRA